MKGVNTFNDVIQRVKEVEQFLGQTIPPPVQWADYPIGCQYPNPQGAQYPYGHMMPPGQAYPGQTPVPAQGAIGPTFPPQGQAQSGNQQSKMNFMAVKSVSFSTQLETVIRETVMELKYVSESTSPKGSGQLHQKDPQESQGSGVANQALLEKELNIENQLKRTEILINHLSTNKAALERAHDRYE